MEWICIWFYFYTRYGYYWTENLSQRVGRADFRPLLPTLCLTCVGCFYVFRGKLIYVSDILCRYTCVWHNVMTFVLMNFYLFSLYWVLLLLFYVHKNLHCICYALIYSRILAFWLMLSVVKTTWNKAYLILSYLFQIHQSIDNQV